MKKIIFFSLILVLFGIREYNIYKYGLDNWSITGLIVGKKEEPVSASDALAKCLTEKGFAMGGTEWCSHCKSQKEAFGESFQYVEFHNCDIDIDWCRSKGIKGYPTWVAPDGELFSGRKDLATLAEISGCGY